MTAEQAPHPDTWTPSFSKASNKAKARNPKKNGLPVERALDFPLARLLLLGIAVFITLVILRLFAPLVLPADLPIHADLRTSSPSTSENETTITADGSNAFTAVTERPLFLDDRRKPKDPPPAEATAAAAPKSTLEGVIPTGIVAAGDHRIAFLKAPDGEAQITVREGDEIRGWHVLRIEAQAVVFTADGQEKRIEFAKPTTSGGIIMGGSDVQSPAH